MRHFVIATTLVSVCILVTVLGTADADSTQKLAYGQSVRVQGNRITIDRSFVAVLAKHPSLDSADHNIWELIYLINIGDREAISLAIDLLALDYPEGAKVDDHHGTRVMARALSDLDDVFWNQLLLKPLATRKKVIHFYDVNRTDYVGHDYEEEKARMLSAK